MTLPATPHTVSLQLSDVNALATTPIQNLSSATDVPVTPGTLLPVQSKSGVIAFVQAEWEAYVGGNFARLPYFILDPQSTLGITADSPTPNAAYPYGDPTVVPGPEGTVIAAQSALTYSPLPGEPNANPVYSPNAPGRWRRLNIGVALAP